MIINAGNVVDDLDDILNDSIENINRKNDLSEIRPLTA